MRETNEKTSLTQSSGNALFFSIKLFTCLFVGSAYSERILTNIQKQLKTK